MNRGGGVVITGQPGISTRPLVVASSTYCRYPGKPCFLYYLPLRLFEEQRTVAPQVEENFILFQPAGVHIFLST